MSQYGIKETKEVLALGFSLGKALKSAKENDGKIDLNDIGLLLTVIPNVVPAVNDISLVPKELKDLDAAEGQELLDYARQELGDTLSDEELVAQIAAGLEFGIAGLKLASLL